SRTTRAQGRTRSSRSGSSRASRRSRTTGSRTTTLQTSSRRARQPSLGGRMARSVGRVLADNLDDVAGLAFVGLGVILGLGVYRSAGGPAGRFLADAAELGFGWLRVALPVGLVVLGAGLIWW